MKRKVEGSLPSELKQLCDMVRSLVMNGECEACIDPICRAMERYPHAPHPHNLFGIVLEKTGDHISAMKHFRAAWALDPTYLPASYNLDTYGTFFSSGKCAFDESDVPNSGYSKVDIVYDEHGIGRAVRR